MPNAEVDEKLSKDLNKQRSIQVEGSFEVIKQDMGFGAQKQVKITKNITKYL